MGGALVVSLGAFCALLFVRRTRCLCTFGPVASDLFPHGLALFGAEVRLSTAPVTTFSPILVSSCGLVGALIIGKRQQCASQAQ
jgi:hypothetical protein